MAGDLKLKTGDIVVRCGKILKAFKISEDTIFLRPYFASNTNSGDLTYSLPIKNIMMTNIRKIVSTQKLNSLFESVLSQSPKKNDNLDLDAKKSLESNDLEEIMRTVKMLWLEKEVGLGLLPSGKSTIYKQVLNQSAQEVAAVKGLTPENAQLEIISALKVGSQASN